MNVTRSRVALVADMDKLWAIGGYDGMKNLKTVRLQLFSSFNYYITVPRKNAGPWRPRHFGKKGQRR